LSALPQIPVIDAREGGSPTIARAAEAQMRDLLDRARRFVPSPLLGLADRISRRWLERGDNPYLAEIAEIAALAGEPGAYALNTSYEWTCTCGVGDDPDGGVRLLRVLDWRQPGLGHALVVAWQRGPAGEFANVTWPGFVGVITAMAPGRFAVALNQPPMRSWGLTLPVDWLIGRILVGRSRALPPAHLLRRVCETCATYDEARQVLSDTPLCLPALFTLAGTEPGQGCVIERTPHAAIRRDPPAAVANHWVGSRDRGRPRGGQSPERLARMEAALRNGAPWLTPPILNRHTRLVAVMNPSRGRLSLQGREKDGPVTSVTALEST
jgi:hypothetical protein